MWGGETENMQAHPRHHTNGMTVYARACDLSAKRLNCMPNYDLSHTLVFLDGHHLGYRGLQNADVTVCRFPSEIST